LETSIKSQFWEGIETADESVELVVTKEGAAELNELLSEESRDICIA
jgi:hypothetical protein